MRTLLAARRFAHPLYLPIDHPGNFFLDLLMPFPLQVYIHQTGKTERNLFFRFDDNYNHFATNSRRFNSEKMTTAEIKQQTMNIPQTPQIGILFQK